MTSKRVLIVEDEGAIAQMLALILTHTGYQVSIAKDGEEALSRTSAEPPDAIVLDLMLPKLNGWEVCSRIKADPRTRGIPIVIYSTLTHSREIEKTKQFGANLYISKDREVSDVAQALKLLIGT